MKVLNFKFLVFSFSMGLCAFALSHGVQGANFVTVVTQPNGALIAPTIELYSNNTAKIYGVLTNFPNSRTAGIQECINAMPVSPDNIHSGGGVLFLASPGAYYCANNIVISNNTPFTLTIYGLGLNVNGITYSGSVTQNVLTVAGGTDMVMNFNMHDMWVSSINDMCTNLVYTTGLSRCEIDHSWFGPWTALTNHIATRGILFNTTYELGDSLEEDRRLEVNKNLCPIFFSRGLDDKFEVIGNSFLECAGLYAGADHLVCENNMFTDCGGASTAIQYGAIAGVVGAYKIQYKTDISSNSPFCSGAAIISPAVQFNQNRQFFNNHFYYCFAAYFAQGGWGIGDQISFNDTLEDTHLDVIFDGGKWNQIGLYGNMNLRTVKMTNSATGAFGFNCATVFDGRRSFDSNLLGLFFGGGRIAVNGNLVIAGGSLLSAVSTNETLLNPMLYGNGFGGTNVNAANLRGIVAPSQLAPNLQQWSGLGTNAPAITGANITGLPLANTTGTLPSTGLAIGTNQITTINVFAGATITYATNSNGNVTANIGNGSVVTNWPAFTSANVNITSNSYSYTVTTGLGRMPTYVDCDFIPKTKNGTWTHYAGISDIPISIKYVANYQARNSVDYNSTGIFLVATTNTVTLILIEPLLGHEGDWYDENSNAPQNNGFTNYWLQFYAN